MLQLVGVCVVGLDSLAEHPQQLVLKVSRAEVSHSIDEKPALVSVTLTPASQIAFSSFTARHLGQLMEVRFLGRPLMKPHLMEPITGGTLLILPPENGDGAGELARKLSAPSTEIEVAAPVE
jgi:preprotein translocase subunit SecD